MKTFNIAGTCFPDIHYMVDLTERVTEIRRIIDHGDYFCINRGRQYGKSTTLEALRVALQNDYHVFALSFESLDESSFETTAALVKSFWILMRKQVKYKQLQHLPDEATEIINTNAALPAEKLSLQSLDDQLSELCLACDKKCILLIDEVDQASNCPSFLKLLGLFRNKYLERNRFPTFYSVILASVYDIKNLKLKIRDENEHQYNSPWNIAVNFNVKMALQEPGIAAMLTDYETDHHTGMDVPAMAQRLYAVTNGYPFLVSRLCKIMADELKGTDDFPSDASCWTKEGFLAAEKMVLNEKNTLFDDMFKKLRDQPSLRTMLYNILCHGARYPFVSNDPVIELGDMFSFIRNDNGQVAIANVIYETVLYDVFMSETRMKLSEETAQAMGHKSLYVTDGHLDMKYVMERFVQVYPQIHNGTPFLEKDVRCLFLFFLKPIINGTGHYYVEPQTRDDRRMDIVVNYGGEQFVIELKIWRGDAYNDHGIDQLCGYLDSLGENRGFLLTFNFNQKKDSGLQITHVNGKTIVQAMV